MTDDKNVFTLGQLPSNKKRAAASAATSRPAAEPAGSAERQFVEAARTHTVPAAEKHADWQSLDPEERLTRGINVRFNDYELGLLRHLADLQDRSIHQTLKRLLIPAALELLGQLERQADQSSKAG